MARRRSSNITVANRHEAIIAAKDLMQDLREIIDDHGRCAALEKAQERATWACYALAYVQIDRATISHHLAEILTAGLPVYWRLAWVRLRIAKLQQALGLPVDPDCAAALAAKERPYAEGAWNAYVDALPLEAVEIEIPVREGCA